jgi:hypothetical protein
LWTAFIFAFAVIDGSAVCAHAQSVTTLDGAYKGVSLTAKATVAALTGACRPSVSTPRPLTISGGVAQFDAGPTGVLHLQGIVTASGSLTLRDDNTRIIAAQIDPNGKITGAGGGSTCAFTFVWQRQN